ncbi:YcxB family protein [Blastopirellula sp. JC732]|uniref:YcxB family protein n=1 Tax=Blastopirellula sediminis TaxID=2894196 RepID=A0A9X1MPX9_9BACT|nr:YcxB family protein [Blastopirellula sediminis]MCC9607258.1 YcxB family protein [Blastopirellula sediminis]MCC9629449.1 YcxB family protein [Blastopirellula sediminis]
MQVEFESHSHDAAAISGVGSSQQTWRTNLLLIVCGVLVGLPGVIPSLVLGFRWVALMIGIVYFSVLFQYAKRLLQKPDDVYAPAAGVIRFRLNPNYLEHEFQWNRGRTAWSHIQEIVIHDSFLHIHVDSAISFVIPRRAFGAVDDMREFAQTAQSYLAAARTASLPAIGLYDDDFFVAWTREAGLSVEYQTARSDWAYALEKGSSDPNWRSWISRVARNSFYLVLFVAMMFMAFNVQHIGFAAFSLVASAIFWYVGTISLLFLMREKRRERTVPDQWLAKQNLFISPAGVISMTSFAIYCSNWQYYESILHDTGFIYFVADGQVCVLAPKDSFPTYGQAQHFAQEAIVWHETALKPKQEEEPTDDSPLVDEENPYRSPKA